MHASAASWAWTTAWSAACWPAAGACPNSLATAIERHHSDDATGEAAIVRLADMLAHYGHGAAVDPKQLLNAARALELTPEQLRDLMYEIPYAANGKKRHVDPCPLSSRELDVLKKLAEGKVYKQIALGAGAVHQHRAHAPAQHLRQARRGRSRSGGAAGHRPRLDLIHR